MLAFAYRGYSKIGIVLALAGSVWLAGLLHVPFVFDGGLILVAFLFSAVVGLYSAISRHLMALVEYSLERRRPHDHS